MSIVRGSCVVLEFVIVGSEVLTTPLDQKKRGSYMQGTHYTRT